jgi:hypothetical protein
MPIEVEAPDGAVVEFPDGTPAATIKGVMSKAYPPPKPEMGLGEYAGNVARTAANSALFNWGGELGLIDEKKVNEFAEQYPIASTVASLGGAIVPFAGPIGAATRLGQAARWATSGRTLPRTAGRSALFGAGAGAVAGAGAGEGLEGRLGEAATGATVGGLLGGAVPPAVSGFVGAGRKARDMLSPQMARAAGAWEARGAPSSPPPAGRVAWIDDRTPLEMPTPGAEAQTNQMLANQAMRAGLTVDDLRARLAQADLDRTFYPGRDGGSRGADTATLMDIDDSFARMAGSVARASPEARNRLETFLTARQTGLPPRRGMLDPDSGLTVREPGVPRVTETARGATRIAPPAGQYERVHEGFKRALAISDEDFHGHAANPLRTEQQILKAARDEAKPLYDAAYQAGEGVDLRPVINPILQRWQEERLIQEPEPVQRAIRGLLRLFQSPTGDLRRFDKAKQFADGAIEKWFESPIGRNRYVGGLLTELKNELLAAVDAVPAVGPAYARARSAFSDRMTARDILTRFRDSFWKADSEITADDFLALTSREQQKLARLGMLWGFERQAGTERTRDVTRIFNNPRMHEMLGRMMPSTALESGRATPADIASRFLRFVETERAQAQLRQRVLGGSPTAERLADDAAFESMNDVINQFRGSTGALSMGIAYVSRILNKLFGYQADAALGMAMRMTVSDPAARERALEEIARRMGRNRFEEFARLLAENQSRFGAAAAGIAPAAAAQAPQGPMDL